MTPPQFIQLGSDRHEIFAVAQIACVYPEVYRVTDAHRRAYPRLRVSTDVVYAVCIGLIGSGGREYLYNSRARRDEAIRKISQALAPTILVDPVLAIDIADPVLPTKESPSN